MGARRGPHAEDTNLARAPLHSNLEECGFQAEHVPWLVGPRTIIIFLEVDPN